MSDDILNMLRVGGLQKPSSDRIIEHIEALRAENEKLWASLHARDQFIVENGLWSEFTRQVDKLTRAAAAALKETGDD